MPRQPSTDSNTPLLDLHPVLQNTLQCLDVRLEDELARYRRARRRSPIQSRWGTEGLPMVPPVGEMAKDPSSVIGTAALAIAPHLPADLEPETSDAWMEQPPGMQASPNIAPSAPPPDYPDYLESSEHLLRGLAEDEVELRSEAPPRMLDTLLTPLGVGSMVLLLLSSVTLGYVITNPNGLPFLSAGNSAQEETALTETTVDSVNTDPQTDDTTAFYPDLSSEEFRDLNLDTLSTLPEDEVATPTPSPASPSPEAQPSPTNATGERTASPPTTTAPTSRPSPAASPQRTAAAPSPRPATPSPRPATSQPTATAPSPRPAASPSRPTPRPSTAAASPTPSRPAPSPVAAAPTAPEPYFYVVTDYTGDRSLSSARDAVADAYVRNFDIGAVIQFGAFSEESGAEALLQDLQQQGIPARVYRTERN